MSRLTQRDAAARSVFLCLPPRARHGDQTLGDVLAGMRGGYVTKDRN